MVVETSLLGQLLLKAKLISEEQLNYAFRIQKIDGKRLGSILVKLGYLSEDTLISFLSKQYNAPSLDLAKYNIDTTLFKLIPYETAKKYQLLPVSKEGASLKIAISDPSYTQAIDDIKFITGMKVSVYVASQVAILDAIEKHYPKKDKDKIKLTRDSGSSRPVEDGVVEPEKLKQIIGSALEEITVVEEKEEEQPKGTDAPIVKLANSILINAIKSRSSDIHIEPAEDLVRVRYRIDGVLQPVLKLPVKIKNALTSRIKILSHLDISERRLPQDGRTKLKFGDDREIDFRVSTLPTLYGEKVVLRILDKSSLQVDMTSLGFGEQALQDFMNAIDKPYGMVLVTGPTGSGKTTTLYSALQRLNKPGVNILTAEDPIEYNFFGINQTQMKEEIGLTFASALRSFLRQDPDIIMVGEIRDFETAEIAVKAALTGHLVLSTLHTNDAASSITRLINMGIEPFLVSSSVNLVAAQRLVRRICENCKEEHKISSSTLEKVGFAPEEARSATCYMGMGCASCNNTGYRGRLALYEVMPLHDELKELVLQGSSALELKKTALQSGMITLRQSGIRKVIEGLTTIDEVLKVTFED